MANQIRITPDQMRTRANEYRTEAETVNGVIQKMDSLLGQLQSEWCTLSGAQARLHESRRTHPRDCDRTGFHCPYRRRN